MDMEPGRRLGEGGEDERFGDIVVTGGVGDMALCQWSVNKSSRIPLNESK